MARRVTTTRTVTTRSTTDYVLVLEGDITTLRGFRKITDQLEFEELLKLTFEKLLGLKSDGYLYDYLHRAAKSSVEVTDLRLLINQLFALARHVEDQYRWLVMDLTYDSSFMDQHDLHEVIVDEQQEALVLLFNSHRH